MKNLINDLRGFLIMLFYCRWHNKDRVLEDGYTLLVPTPSDLPVFLELTLEVLSKQDLNHLKEIIVIPDWPSTEFEAYFSNRERSQLSVPVRFINLSLKDKLAWRLTKSVNTRHFSQLVKAVDSIKTKHAIIHDADLFLVPGRFLLEQYVYCRDHGLNVYGLDIRRSFSRSDRKEFVATWEMVFLTSWFLSFAPSRHKGQVLKINGRRQDFDTTLLPQYMTDPSTIAWKDRNREYFHFNYVICGYRYFLNKKDYSPSYSLKLFLIRTLIDAFDCSGWGYDCVPSHQDFLEGKHGIKELIADKISGKRLFDEFFAKMNGILQCNMFDGEKAFVIERRVKELVQVVG
jgi:hypothetical protein